MQLYLDNLAIDANLLNGLVYNNTLHLFLYTFVLLFLISLIGILINRKHVIVLLMCVELILLSVFLAFCIISVLLNEYSGYVYALMIITLAAGESAIALSVLIIYYRIFGSIALHERALLKG